MMWDKKKIEQTKKIQLPDSLKSTKGIAEIYSWWKRVCFLFIPMHIYSDSHGPRVTIVAYKKLFGKQYIIKMKTIEERRKGCQTEVDRKPE